MQHLPCLSPPPTPTVFSFPSPQSTGLSLPIPPVKTWLHTSEFHEPIALRGAAQTLICLEEADVVRVTGAAAVAPAAGEPSSTVGDTGARAARGPSVPPRGLPRGSHLSAGRSPDLRQGFPLHLNYFRANIPWGFPGGASGEESTCQCRRCRFDRWVRKLPWRREWEPTPVFLPGEFHGQRNLTGYSPQGCKDL